MKLIKMTGVGIGKMGGRIEFEGTIKKVVFVNPDNNFTVIVVRNSELELTATGMLPPVMEGEHVKLVGRMRDTGKYGEQFVIRSIEIEALDVSESAAVVRYLASGFFRGVGPVTAARIVEAFGENTLKVMQNTPEQLERVPGITMSKATMIGEQARRLNEMQDTLVYLQTLNMSMSVSMRIWKKYEKNARWIIESNPYRLANEIDGIGFLTADRYAVRLGLPLTSDFRLSAGIMYALNDAVSMYGHTYLPQRELVESALRLLRLSRSDEYSGLILDELHNLAETGDIMSSMRNNQTIHMLTKHYILEKTIAGCLSALEFGRNELKVDIAAEIARYEKENGILLHEGQKNAVRRSLENGVSVITGGPGTGKTTIIKCILSILKSVSKTAQLTAPTGRAAKRMSAACGVEASTIHRLLELDFKSSHGGHYGRNEERILKEDVVIVDEASMCDEVVFCALVKSIKLGNRLIIVGDKDQLPSVGAGNVLADIINSNTVVVSYLTEIYRQEAESLIIFNAHRINSGMLPDIDNSSRDFFLVNRRTENDVLTTLIGLVETRLTRYLNTEGRMIQVLCPLKRGITGVDNVNIAIQRALNPPSPDKAELKYISGDILREGDKVMHTVNNYHLEWKSGDGELGMGVFNGDMGVIERIDKKAGTLVVRFEDGKVATYKGGDETEQLSLAYAISIHKSQGSEFDAVIVVLVGGNSIMLTRNLLYTALTRAKRFVALVGPSESISHMVKNNNTANRYSMLSEMMKDEWARLRA